LDDRVATLVSANGGCAAAARSRGQSVVRPLP